MAIATLQRPKSAPVASSGATAVCPIDHEHLARYTLGDRALELEVLQLFAGQAPRTLDQLNAATDEESWHAAAHTLKGSAKAVGAFELARAAQAAETAGFGHSDAELLIAEVKSTLKLATGYVRRLAETADNAQP